MFVNDGRVDKRCDERRFAHNQKMKKASQDRSNLGQQSADVERDWIARMKGASEEHQSSRVDRRFGPLSSYRLTCEGFRGIPIWQC